jgi:VWFA-related protein
MGIATPVRGLESEEADRMGRLSKSNFVLVFAMMLSYSALGGRASWAQGTSAIPSTPSKLATTPAAGAQQEIGDLPLSRRQIRVRTNEVTVPVTVLDKNGELVLDLTDKEFHVLDNGVEQPIDHCELGGNPLAVALVVETSSRIKMMAPVIHDVGSIFTETVMALNGEAAVISYDNAVDVRQGFTEDHDAVQKAIKELQFEVPEMALYDGMAKGVELLKVQPPDHRRVMIVIGESQDWSSTAKLGQVLRDAQHEDIVIYAIGPSGTMTGLRGGTKGLANGMQLPPIKLGKLPPMSTVRPHDDPLGRPYYDWLTPAVWLLTRGLNEIKNHQLEVAANATGGAHYRIFRDRTIRTVLDEVGGEIHAQYTLTYKVPTGDAADFHRIAVTVSRADVNVRARLGYFVSPGEN